MIHRNQQYINMVKLHDGAIEINIGRAEISHLYLSWAADVGTKISKLIDTPGGEQLMTAQTYTDTTWNWGARVLGRRRASDSITGSLAGSVLALAILIDRSGLRE
jgi:hypothetical protein